MKPAIQPGMPCMVVNAGPHENGAVVEAVRKVQMGDYLHELGPGQHCGTDGWVIFSKRGFALDPVFWDELGPQAAYTTAAERQLIPLTPPEAGSSEDTQSPFHVKTSEVA